MVELTADGLKETDSNELRSTARLQSNGSLNSITHSSDYVLYLDGGVFPAHVVSEHRDEQTIWEISLAYLQVN